MHITKVIPHISADGHHAIYVECDITPIKHKQIPREITIYCKKDWEGLKEPTFHQNTHNLFFRNSHTCVHHQGNTTHLFPIKHKQIPREIKIYCKKDWEGLKDQMSTIKDSFMALHSVNIPQYTVCGMI